MVIQVQNTAIILQMYNKSTVFLPLTLFCKTEVNLIIDGNPSSEHCHYVANV